MPQLLNCLQNSKDEAQIFGYDKCSKVWNTFLFLFSNKMLVIRAKSHILFVRLVNRKDLDQTTPTSTLV